MARGGAIEVIIRAEGLQKALAEAERRCIDQRPAWKACKQVLRTAVLDNFEAQGARGGHEKWQELADSTLIARIGGIRKTYTKRGTIRASAQRRITGHKILQRTRRLMRTIGYEAGKDFVSGGSNLVYAAIHNFGGMAGRGLKVKIPQREYLFVTDEDLEEMGSTIVDYIASAME